MSGMRARLASLQARIEGLLDGMSPRDRNLFMGLVVFFSLVLVGGGAYMMNGHLNTLEKDRDARIADLDLLEGQLQDQAQAQLELERIQGEMAKFDGQDLSSFMEKAAEGASIRDRLESVRENSVSELDDLEEKSYSVKLTRVDLDQMVHFLYQVEATGYPLRITSAKFKRVKVSGEWLLNVTLEIAAYRLLKEEG